MATAQKNLINIDGESALVRDKNSKAVLNKDNEGLKAYKLQQSRIDKFIKYESDINTLRTEITELKDLIQGLVNKINK